jgi:PAS domain S-box-containing protein
MSTEADQRRLLVEAAENGMLVVDAAGIIELANAQAERVFGYAPGALRGRSVAMLECPALDPASDPLFDRAESVDPIVASLNGGGVAARCADGSTVRVDVQVQKLSGVSGGLALFLVSDRREPRVSPV